MESEVGMKLFTVEEYLRMGEAGIFHPEARLELIEGEIIEMSPVGDLRYHSALRPESEDAALCKIRRARIVD